MAAQHSRMLAELADIAMQLARAAGRRALAQAEIETDGADHTGQGDAPQADPGLAFTRIARCVRQTLALQAKLAQAHRARADGVGGLSAPWRPPEGAIEALNARLRRMMDAAEDDEGDDEGDDLDDGGDREDLLADLHERLDDPDPAGRHPPPAGEAVARLRRNLERFSNADDENAPASGPRPAPRDLDPWPHPAADGEHAAPGGPSPGRAPLPP